MRSEQPIAIEYYTAYMRQQHDYLFALISQDMPVETYVEMCKEITKLFDLLGSALGFAFSSVRKYIAFLEECQKELPPPQPEGSTWTIQKVVEREIQSGAVEQGDKKNPTAAR